MSPDLPPEAWAQIRHDYEHTETPVGDICAEHGISAGTLRDRMRRWRWTRRRQPIPSEGPPPTAVPRIEHPAPFFPAAPQIDTAAPQAAAGEGAGVPLNADPALIVPRLKGAVARVLPAIEATVAKLAAGSTHPREMEQAGRALGSLTRTLRELNALLGQYPEPADNDRGPEDNDEFIRDLARRMDAFAAAHTGAAGGGAPEGS